MSVPIEQMTEDTRTQYLERGFQPLVGSFNHAEFAQEWDAVFDAVKNTVSKKWQFGLGDEDFFMSSDWGRDRLIVVEVMNEAVVSLELVHEIHDVLCAVEKDYAVDVCNAWGAMEDQQGNLYPDFHVLITKDRVKVYSESQEILNRFGL